MNEPNTYYIDPNLGRDDHCGSSGDTPWRTFARLAETKLTPGDRVEILSPGAFDHSLVLTGEGTAENPVIVHFAPGRYDFFPTRARREVFNISNCNDDVAKPKAIGVYFKHVRHVSLSGPGAAIIFRGKMIELCVDHSEAITISDLRFDYHRPTVSEFAATATGPDSADITVHPDSHYRVTEGKILWQGEGWQYETGLAQELIPETEQVWRRKDPLRDLRIEELAPFHLRAYGQHDMVAGHIYQLRDTYRDCCGVFIRRSKDITLDHVDFSFMHGMGILCQFTETVTLDSVRIAPEEGSGRTTAAWADCAHFSGCRGKITMRNCLFCGAHDDAVNVHGTHLRIVEQIGDHQIKVRFMHRQTYGFMAFNPGDTIEFVRWDTLGSFGTNRVVTAKLLNPRELVLELEKPVPDWLENDVIENVTWTPEVDISGCTVARIPTRGFLLTTRQPVRITNNTFKRIKMFGIHVESDAKGWFESGSVKDLLIEKNQFLDCEQAAIRISPHKSKPNPSVHRNISIIDNDIQVPENARAIEVAGTSGLTLSGNHIQAPSLDPNKLFLISDCENVTITHA
ncbi:MAG: right-handed parallel beta-helix repeat-containing protein [Lentisphaeria bacterium]|nr:right-handed parallel beta-helix repeat-containing protein [Lentisphaeria bacterium]